jgi:hypothetical protein
MLHIFFQVCKDHVFELQSKQKKNLSHLLTEISLNLRNVEAVTPIKGKRKNKGLNTFLVPAVTPGIKKPHLFQKVSLIVPVLKKKPS